ncbi:uncharacterized protein K02A2.6-like [Bacillus rossius redtenbacheri]|uniref:uncharacterized protein K02A2.6-like n=1 Tax=Bacillus rossius redtenbacheri TaxID=93214 RepID=UPI002FDEDF9A
MEGTTARWGGAPAATGTHHSLPDNSAGCDGPISTNTRGNRFLIVVTYLFTRWMEAYPCRNVRATTITKILAQEFLLRWGYPQSALSDNGSQFLGRQWRTWCDDHQIQHHTTPTYHPRANTTERRNQELKVQMRIRLSSDHAQWDRHISDALFCMHCRVNAATGRTPAEMVQGHNIPLPGEWATHGVPPSTDGPEERDRRCTATHEEVRQWQKFYAMEITPMTNHTPPTVQAGDQVFVRVHPLLATPRNYCAGLAPRWGGPYMVQRCLGQTTYLVRLGGRRVKKIHRDDLRLAKLPGDRLPELPVTLTPPEHPAPRRELDDPTTPEGEGDEDQNRGQVSRRRFRCQRLPRVIITDVSADKKRHTMQTRHQVHHRS